MDDVVQDDRGTIKPHYGSNGSRSASATIGKLPSLIADERGRAAAHVDLGSEELGRGAMGVVHLARQGPLRRDVAVKTLLDETVGVDERLQMLCEARVTGALEHPNIVPIYMLGGDETGAPVIVMKRITGTPWSELLADPTMLREREHVIDPLVWHLEVLTQVCNALHYAHAKQVIHRDMKPDNVMIGEFGEVCVLDWGLAVSLNKDNDLGLPHVRQIDGVAGTPTYMAPEAVAVLSDQIGVTTDVYTLGAVLHEIVTGETRHDGDTMTDVLLAALASEPYAYGESVDKQLAAICNQATAPDPAQRFQSADELRLAIDAYLQQRHSLRLGDEATERLDELCSEVADCRPDDDQAAVDIHRLYGECRFGFREALREWSDSPGATAGLQRLLEVMARYEIGHDNPQAAAAMIADLPEPKPEIEAELTALKTRLQERQAELDAIRRQEDTAPGKTTRLTILALMMFIWTGSYFAFGAMMRAGVFTNGHAVFTSIVLAYGAFLAVATLRWRQVLWETRTNRRFLWGLWAAFVASMSLWPAAWYRAVPFGDAVAANMLLYATIMWMSAAAVDRRLIWGSAPYLVGAGVSAFFPAYAWEAMALATLAAMGAASAVWRSPPPSTGVA
jgi:hypothetical protein